MQSITPATDSSTVSHDNFKFTFKTHKHKQSRMGCKVCQKYFYAFLKGEILVMGKIINNIHHGGKASGQKSISHLPGLADSLGFYHITLG